MNTDRYQFDEIVTPPAENARLPGATTIGVQQLCPGRVVDHIYLIQDAAAYALQIDALKHGGKADLVRIKTNDPLVCLRQYGPGMDPNALTQLALVTNGATEGLLQV